METEKNKLFGLVGKNISYSFSRSYFSEKFQKLGVSNYEYVNFDIPSINKLPTILSERKDNLIGFNVTIPYKGEIISLLDKVDDTAKSIDAVNTVLIESNGQLKGFNTDIYGFENSFKPLLKPLHQKALILGTGGASRAIEFVLNKLNIKYKFVSRNPSVENQITYSEITKEVMNEFTIIINCTPLGTYPDIEKCPSIPYQFLTSDHLLYDLIYNPAETTFLKNGKKVNATIKNGLEMLELQAEKAWEIWQNR
ncbi:MAG: shikimate dehydrogenase family protein [Polaribacter sp.]